ncbi:testis-expressed protein 9 [Amyelois transitella]|uniref:testis-expressed protein 9 n=1 Tax=Amyelois transitella TaxID=680683 RepID=UPI00067B25C0|nr:testis-expressed protein 9 [Amyelois transitella]
MDSLDLLAREDEFKKLNKQLEKKTESLMREIEHVMQKQDFFADFSQSLTFGSRPTTKKHCHDSPISTPEKVKTKPKKKLSDQTVSKFENGTNKKNEINNEICANVCTDDENCANKCTDLKNKFTDDENMCRSCTKRVICHCCTVPKGNTEDTEFLNAFVSVSVQEKVLPASFLKDRLSVDIICKFLSSKIKLMQEQMDRLQNTIENKASQCKNHMTKLAELEGERMSLLTRTNNFKSTAGDLRAKCGVLEGKLQEKDRLYKEQRGEADKLTIELKRLKNNNASVEARCASHEEVIDKLKHQIEDAKRAEKEFRDSSRSLSASHQNAISRLEGRIKSLTTRVEKQKALIENLRKQNALLATEGALKVLEREYSNFLTQD